MTHTRVTPRRRRAFSLLELMTVVAVLAILAAIAIPQLYSAQLRAKRSELVANVHDIRDRLALYQLDHEVYIEESGSGAGIPDGGDPTQRKPWPTGTNFDEIGWQPDGDVYGAYFLAPTNVPNWCAEAGPSDTVPSVMGSLNVDGDGDAFNMVVCVDSGPGSLFPEPIGQGGAMSLADY